MLWKAPVIVVAVLSAAACATVRGPATEALSIEFGQDRYLDGAYLRDAAASQCGPPTFAPGGMEVRADLPDQSWFRIVAVPGPDSEPSTVVLERGHEGESVLLTMHYDGGEGIVRLVSGDRRDAWGEHHAWADWMRDLGTTVLTIDCP